MEDPLKRFDVQAREHEAWVEAAQLLRSIGFDINDVDVVTFEPARRALVRWALVYAEGYDAGVFTMPEGDG
jgi:hypothetical protein